MNLLTSNHSESNQANHQNKITIPAKLKPLLSNPTSAIPANSTRDKISFIASKLITGVQPVSGQQANNRWNAQHHGLQSLPNPPPSQSSDPPRSITASVFAAARLERAAQRQALHQPSSNQLPRAKDSQQRPLSAIHNHQPSTSSSTPPQIYHHRSHTQLDIFAPPKPPFAQPAVVPSARSVKTSAPAVMDAGDDHPAFLQSIQDAAAAPSRLGENLPPGDPRPNLIGYQDPHQSPSPSKAPRSFLPPKSFNPQPNFTQPTHTIKDIYLSQVGDRNGKIENEKQKVDREFEKLLDTMQITPAVRIKMTGLDHPVKSAMLKSSTSTSLMNLINPQEVHHPSNHHHQRAESASTLEDQKHEGSAWWAMYLKSHNFRELLATDLKRLRVALRTKKPSWTKEFVGFGGYTALLKRLKELLEIEWREEQHDDQVLYEILRCCKALLLTEPGRQALGSRLPDPFIQLTGLLYSEKKPGDLATRQVIVELVQGCFELEEYITNKPLLESHQLNWNALISLSEAPPLSSNPTHHAFPSDHDGHAIRSQSTHDAFISNSHALVFHLLVGPPDPKVSQIVEFVAVSRRVRKFKTFVNEFTGVLMDYFWIFCHNENPFWDLKAIDEESIEAPKVPSGMTGGVEYEAMSYCTYLMKLINQLIKSSESSEKSQSIYQDLFISGFERCLITLRKSSMNYYPMVHLELSRFIHLGLEIQFEFPYNILKHIHGYHARPL